MRRSCSALLLVLVTVAVLMSQAGCPTKEKPKDPGKPGPKLADRAPYTYDLHPDNKLANDDNNKYNRVPDRVGPVDLMKSWWAKFEADASAVDDVAKVEWYLDEVNVISSAWKKVTNHEAAAYWTAG